MKNLCISLALIGALTFSTQGAFAAWEGAQSLNPFTGFKNCNKCKVKKVKCDECTKVKIKPCPTCRKAFAEPSCPTCERIYIQPVQPKCPCMNNY